jgi:hypothetical protein
MKHIIIAALLLLGACRTVHKELHKTEASTSTVSAVRDTTTAKRDSSVITSSIDTGTTHTSTVTRIHEVQYKDSVVRDISTTTTTKASEGRAHLSKASVSDTHATGHVQLEATTATAKATDSVVQRDVHPSLWWLWILIIAAVIGTIIYILRKRLL